jgi:hypothetical protein
MMLADDNSAAVAWVSMVMTIGNRRPPMTRFAPVPDVAVGPEIPESGYRVTELGGGADGITSGLVNARARFGLRAGERRGDQWPVRASVICWDR